MQVRNKDRVDSQLLKIQGYLKPGNQFLIKYHANKHVLVFKNLNF